MASDPGQKNTPNHAKPRQTTPNRHWPEVSFGHLARTPGPMSHVPSPEGTLGDIMGHWRLPICGPKSTSRGVTQMSHLSHPPKVRHSATFATFASPHFHRPRPKLRKTFSSVQNVRPSTASTDLLLDCSRSPPASGWHFSAHLAQKMARAKSAICHMPQKV
jgi:hypothetical protein